MGGQLRGSRRRIAHIHRKFLPSPEHVPRCHATRSTSEGVCSDRLQRRRLPASPPPPPSPLACGLGSLAGAAGRVFRLSLEFVMPRLESAARWLWGMRECASPENGAVQLVAADGRAPVWRRCERALLVLESVYFSEFDYRSGVGGRSIGLDHPESFPSRNTSALIRRGLF
ncbi:hypothetical protein CKAH01_00757 [Colletotrichum kahawae]|uniref:Uncharacterized protein n=1 Tax=Colletotrichum kahawae TaxID=34407 RepID=A0AAE0DB45_COLKA|nr:hypothetical protein CKAH01_00757 [Colletotrichum kahawae]